MQNIDHQPNGLVSFGVPVEQPMTPKELRAHYKISRTLYFQLIREGLPYVMIRKRRRHYLSAVDAYFMEKTGTCPSVLNLSSTASVITGIKISPSSSPAEGFDDIAVALARLTAPRPAQSPSQPAGRRT